jgi:uncharacterized spore protein YtfJ
LDEHNLIKIILIMSGFGVGGGQSGSGGGGRSGSGADISYWSIKVISCVIRSSLTLYDFSC